MAQTVLVTVENIKNTSVKRQMTVASAKLNSRKWRVISDAPALEVKKKGVEVAAGKPKLGETANSFAPSDEFATIGTTEKETLQTEYEELSGTKPDGRWNEGKLKEKIAALKSTPV